MARIWIEPTTRGYEVKISGRRVRLYPVTPHSSALRDALCYIAGYIGKSSEWRAWVDEQLHNYNTTHKPMSSIRFKIPNSKPTA